MILIGGWGRPFLCRDVEVAEDEECQVLYKRYDGINTSTNTDTEQLHLWLSEGSIPSHFRGFLEEKNSFIAAVNSVLVFFSKIKSYRFILNFSEGNTAICICMTFKLSERLWQYSGRTNIRSHASKHIDC